MTEPTRPAFPLVWDSTMRGSFVACPRKFHWEFMRRLAPSTTSIHLHFGGAFAAGLEAFRREFYDPDSSNYLHFDASFSSGLRAILSYWGDGEDSPDPSSPKNLETCLLALGSYLENWPPATDYILPYQSATGPAVEFRFALPLEDVHHPDTGEPLVYAGRFDMLGVYNNQLYVVDEKTTSRLGPTWANQWTLRAQFTGYCHAAQQFDLPVAGAIVRGTSILTKSFGHAESINPLQQWRIDRWREQLSRDLRRAIECYQSGYWDYDLDSACTAYSGCSFRRLCESPNPERWIEPYYVERFWNPLAVDPTAPTPPPEEYPNG